MYMPTVLIIKNLMFVIHTRDHGHPHVTVYLGSPERYEARAKIRLDVVKVIENKGFSTRDMAIILENVDKYLSSFKEVWDEIKSRQ
jgi:hypothetical protein